MTLDNVERCIYDETEAIRHTLDNIDHYLRSMNIRHYSQSTAQMFDRGNGWLKNEFGIDSITDKNIRRLMVIVDRRGDQDIVYSFPVYQSQALVELYGLYFIGFEFIVRHSTVAAYLRYGINERLRFFPEMLTTVVPRLFFRPIDVTAAEYLDVIYGNTFKHGWAVDLIDNKFNEMHKLCTNVTHVSVNYDRTSLDDTTNISFKYELSFRDIFEFEIIACNMDKVTISQLHRFLSAQQYDSESIVADILLHDARYAIRSNLQRELSLIGGQVKDFYALQNLAKWFTKGLLSDFSPKCKGTQTLIYDCSHVKKIIAALRTFTADDFDVLPFKYNLRGLLEAHDHILRAAHAVEEDDSKMSPLYVVKEFILEHVDECEEKHCVVLERHRSRMLCSIELRRGRWRRRRNFVCGAERVSCFAAAQRQPTVSIGRFCEPITFCERGGKVECGVCR